MKAERFGFLVGRYLVRLSIILSIIYLIRYIFRIFTS